MQPNKEIADGIGAWFWTCLGDQVGLDKIFQFYTHLEELEGFGNAFAATFGQSHIEFPGDFRRILGKSQSEIMSVLQR